ncbi:MAG: hypothetical protein V4706_05485 [Pseudomonadota bacterium]
MTLTASADGGYRLTQTLVRPVVYLDHWAIRLFSDDAPLRDRFLDALHRSGGTWLFSTANLMEFIAMTDLQQAARGEQLLQCAMPSLYVADTTLDKGFLLSEGAPEHPDAPDKHWLLTDLANRAALAGGAWNMHRFLQDAINHQNLLLPLFNELKSDVSYAVMSLTQDEKRHAYALKFKPTRGMTLRDALQRELIRDAHVDENFVFDDHDAMDLIHAVPAAVVCDLILLDAGWCHKVERATKRLERGGVTGKLAACYSRKSVSNFLTALEHHNSPTQ